MPRFAGEAREDVIVLGIKLDVVLVQVFEELLGAKDLGNLDKLVRVAVAVEERLLAENHRREHSTKRPHIQGVIVFLEIHQQLGTLEIARSDTDIVFRALVVEFSQTPINQAKLENQLDSKIPNPLEPGINLKSTYLALLVINHDVVRLHIAVHDTLAVAEVERLEQLENVESDIVVGKAGV